MTISIMKALVYHGPGNKAWEKTPDPVIIDDTDEAYDVFERSAATGALKIVLTPGTHGG